MLRSGFELAKNINIIFIFCRALVLVLLMIIIYLYGTPQYLDPKQRLGKVITNFLKLVFFAIHKLSLTLIILLCRWYFLLKIVIS
jgi:hypothetical protein